MFATIAGITIVGVASQTGCDGGTCRGDNYGLGDNLAKSATPYNDAKAPNTPSGEFPITFDADSETGSVEAYNYSDISLDGSGATEGSQATYSDGETGTVTCWVKGKTETNAGDTQRPASNLWFKVGGKAVFVSGVFVEPQPPEYIQSQVPQCPESQPSDAATPVPAPTAMPFSPEQITSIVVQAAGVQPDYALVA